MSTTTAGLLSPINVTENEKMYFSLLIGGAAFIIALVILSVAMWNTLLFSNFDITFNWGPTILEFALLYSYLSLRVAHANEIVGAYFYGKALKRLQPGLLFIPYSLMQIAKETRTVQEFQCPGEPETVFHGTDKEALPPGMVRPIRAVTRAAKKNEKDMLDTRMTLDVSFVVQYSITDIFDYIANFGSMTAVEKQMRDVGEITIVEKITQNTPASFINKLQKVNSELVTICQQRFANSGVRIISVRLISPDITHDVSKAFAAIPIARAEAAQAVIRAEGEKTKRTMEGEGIANAELAMLEARAKGQKAVMKALSISGETVVASEAVRGLSEKTDVLVVGAEGGMKDVMGLVKGAQSALSVPKKGVQS